MATGAVVARGVPLAWDRAGVGTTMIWGHGLTSSRATEDASGLVDWETVRRSADVVRYDARGHGRSGWSDDTTSYGWDELATDQLALADALEIPTWVSGGASMGAATALHVACTAPERVRALVLMIPPTAWETRAAQAEMYETMASIIEQRGVEQLLALGAQTPPPDPFVGDDAWRARREATMREADPVRLAGVLRGATGAYFPAPDRIGAIAVPTLVLAWSGDPGHPVSTAEILHELIPDTRCVVASTAEDVAAWTPTINAFVRELG